MRIRKPVLWSLAVAMLVFALFALDSASAQDDAQAQRLNAALASPDRPAEDRARDAARKPREVLQLVGIESGMTVLDVSAGAGWYTEVLSAAVGPQGKVYMQNSPGFVASQGKAFEDAIRARAARLGNVEVVLRDMGDLGIDGQADAAITALNLHDAYGGGGEKGALEFLGGMYSALKPGGRAAVIDHIGMAGQDNKALHRIQRTTARVLIREAGFQIVSEPEMLMNPSDQHTLSSHDPALGRNTDRFMFVVRKPAM
jgi:predicted methyltransferase